MNRSAMILSVILGLLVSFPVALGASCYKRFGGRSGNQGEFVPPYFTDVSKFTPMYNHVQSKVRTAPNCIFPSFDENLERWDKGGFCMEETLTGGACIGDINGDLIDDLYYPIFDGSDALFLNHGNGTFEDVTTRSQLFYPSIRSNGCIIFDIDNDGDNDLYVSTVGDARFYLFVNDGRGKFVEKALERGLGNQKVGKYRWTGGVTIAVGDYDLDGDLDVMTTEWLPWLDEESQKNIKWQANTSHTNARLFKNLGPDQPGHFEDVSFSANVRPDTSSGFLRRREAAMHEYCAKVSKRRLANAMAAGLQIPVGPSSKGVEVVRAFQQEIKFLKKGVQFLRKLGVDAPTEVEIDATAFAPDEYVLSLVVDWANDGSYQSSPRAVATVSVVSDRGELLFHDTIDSWDERLVRTKLVSEDDSLFVRVAYHPDTHAQAHPPCLVQVSWFLQTVDDSNAVNKKKECDKANQDSILLKVTAQPFLIWSIEEMLRLNYTSHMIRQSLIDAFVFAERIDEEKAFRMKGIQTKVTKAMKTNHTLAEEIQQGMMKKLDINHAAPFPLVGQFQFAAKFSDLDSDGFPDIVVSGDFGTSRMFWNLRNGTFVEGHFNLVEDLYDNSMGATIGDVNNDGKFDIMFTSTSISESDFKDISKIAFAAGLILNFRGNHLYMNLGGRRFEDKTEHAGVRESGWGWGAFFFDFDNDGDLDILNGNGMDDPETTDDDWAINQPMRLYVNQGEEEGYRFTEEGKLRRIASTEENRATIAWDYDQDGDLDVFVINHAARPQLFRNDGGNYYDFLRVKVYGAHGSESIGALVTVQVYQDDVEERLVREIGSSAAFLGEGERLAHFGLGKLPLNTLIHKVNVTWFDLLEGFQRYEVIYDVPPRTTLVVTRGSTSRTNMGRLNICSGGEQSTIPYTSDEVIEMPVLDESELDPSHYGLPKRRENEILLHKKGRGEKRARSAGNRHHGSNHEDENELRNSFDW